MESKDLKEGLQRIIDGFESGDYPYESDFIDILKGAIENQKACSHSALNAGLDTLSASEAIYGLLAWLTCRDEAVTFSAKHDAAIAAELAKQFCEENNLADPKDDFHTRLIHPKGEIAIEGRGKNAGD